MEAISAAIMDLHTDVADLEAKESFLDRMINNCRAELKHLTDDPEIARYPFTEVILRLLLPMYLTQIYHKSWKLICQRS